MIEHWPDTPTTTGAVCRYCGKQEHKDYAALRACLLVARYGEPQLELKVDAA